MPDENDFLGCVQHSGTLRTTQLTLQKTKLRLLGAGLGKVADDQGRVSGVKVSLFDVLGELLASYVMCLRAC